MEIGIYTFVEATPDPVSGRALDPVQRMRNLLEEVKLADELGLDVFGLGEHHRADYLISAPAVALAAAASITKNIRLTSAVTVLSSDDPVRVYQDFATLDVVTRSILALCLVADPNTQPVQNPHHLAATISSKHSF